MKNIEKIMSRNIPEIMEKISCFLCRKQDKLFIKIGLVCESENRPHSPFYQILTICWCSGWICDKM